jgi:hypothetical protein
VIEAARAAVFVGQPLAWSAGKVNRDAIFSQETLAYLEFIFLGFED